MKSQSFPTPKLNWFVRYLPKHQANFGASHTHTNFFPQTYFFLFLLEEITDSFIQSFQHKSIFTNINSNLNLPKHIAFSSLFGFEFELYYATVGKCFHSSLYVILYLCVYRCGTPVSADKETEILMDCSDKSLGPYLPQFTYWIINRRTWQLDFR